jgi:hypothetical protein
MGLGSLLGAAAGALIPGGGALTTALGAGIGSLIEGDDPRDAIRNAAIAGIGAKVFPNVTTALQNSGFGQAVTNTFGRMGVGTAEGLAGLRNTTAVAQSPVPTPRPSNIRQVAGGEGGIFGGEMNLGQAAGLLTLAGALETPQQTALSFNTEGYGESGGLRDDVYKNLYANRYTGERYSTPEERDAAERAYEETYLNNSPSEYQYGDLTGIASSGYTQVPDDGFRAPRLSPGYRMGGMIEGPGTVTSDSIPGMIMQNGKPVEQIAVSDGEVILSGKDLAGLDPDGNMERAARKLDSVPNGSRGAMAAKMYADMMDMRKRA